MIGNPKWFTLRKYTGWGLTPITWQGWLYTALFVAPIAILESISVAQNFKTIFTTVWIIIFLADIFHIMTQLKKDEREHLHEAISDRNALWFMIFVLIGWVIFKQDLNPIFFIALIGATLVKAATNFYLRDK
ncbi:MAG: hypothetical protein PHE32_00205 [Candidatus Shapirobacteria bacterium]|nr:hypothetical protein [Candidatus Shapirobacteria bacterium]MDD4410122.1 hypothetical protein [Candidatus Shapirobacteria bacterium]